MGDVYELVNTAKTMFSTSRVVLSGVLQRWDVSWHHIGAANSRYEGVAKTWGVTFVDPKRWVDDWDFGRDGPRINWRGARNVGQLYSEVCGIGGGRQKMRSEWQSLVVGTSSEGISEETGMKTFQEYLTSVWKTAQNDKVMINLARRETENETKEECVVVTVVHMIEGKLLILLQVNCRSIYNKTLDFWNLTHIILML